MKWGKTTKLFFFFQNIYSENHQDKQNTASHKAIKAAFGNRLYSKLELFFQLPWVITGCLHHTATWEGNSQHSWKQHHQWKNQKDFLLDSKTHVRLCVVCFIKFLLSAADAASVCSIAVIKMSFWLVTFPGRRGDILCGGESDVMMKRLHFTCCNSSDGQVVKRRNHFWSDAFLCPVSNV